MKKNKMLRLASVLVICVLLTASVIGGTFAKYVTKAEFKDSARVAKWGVTFETGSDLNLFAESYKDPTDATVTVNVGTTGTNLVAPGTKGTGLSLNAKTQDSNKPEVSFKVEIKLDGTDLKLPKLTYTPTDGTATTYEPVKFKIVIGGTETAKTLDELKTGISYTYDVVTNKYSFDANGNSTIEDNEKTDAPPEITIKWEWAIDTGADDAAKALNSKLDTIFGDKAAGIDVTNTTNYPLPTGIAAISEINTDVQLNWEMTATQID